MLTHAWLFPGQGAQYPQMGRHIWRHPIAGGVLSLAESISGLPLRSIIENGPESTLRSPRYSEPAILALQAAHVLLLREQGFSPDAVAGYSLGELGALYCAGCLSLEEALSVASRRGQILTRHSESADWLTLAVSFMQAPAALPLEGCANVYVSAYNSPRDFSITGPSLHVQGVGHILLKHGATISPVAIDGPWHSSLADAAARETAELLRGFEISRPRIPVCLATSGVFQTDCQLMRESLSSQITAAVRWSDSLDTLWRAGVRSTLEVGPGRVLTSFLRANWTQREYIAQFLDRPGGRAFNFASLRAQPPVPLQTLATKENNWSKTA